MAPCFTHQARGLLFLGLLLCSSAASDATNPSQLRARGKVILQQNCGRCHAIGATGESPLKQARPMRDVYARFAPKELQAELREGMVSKHRAMPQIDFSDEDTDAILAYLYALAVKKR
jgi:mono/diheme cytochrome c family protein